MTRPHDMGGRFGDGPVIPEPEGPVSNEEWQKRALAVTVAAGFLGKWNIDASRHARESLAPKDYARFSYYEKWMSGLADLLVNTGLVTREELREGVPTQSALQPIALHARDVDSALAKGGPADRPSDIAPIFAAGDAVKTRRIPENLMVDGGHTRLPQYAAGATGRVVRLHGSHVLPDSAAHRLGDAAEPLYAVAFPAHQLWAHPEHPKDEVVLDLWQSYLELSDDST